MILTSDAASILKELDVVHPAAKLLVMASQQQESEIGDATNLVIILAGELLKKAEELLRMGLKTSDVIQGFDRAQIEALRCLDRAYGSSQTSSKNSIVICKLTGPQSSSLIESRTFVPLPNSPKPFAQS